MIISHKHKFIFIKPKKVAGSSIEVGIEKHCGKDDIITPVTEYSKKSDESIYTHHARNYEGFYNHIPPEEIKNKIGDKIWNNYFKFTIVRNPWDMVVSRYKWQQFKTSEEKISKYINIKKIKRKFFDPKAYLKALRIISSSLDKDKKIKKPVTFEKLVKEFPDKFINTSFYLDSDNKPVVDFYIKFERLEEDYKKVCETLRIPYNKLPRLKSKHRKKEEHYSKFYTDETKKIVAERFKEEIDFFNYSFEIIP